MEKENEIAVYTDGACSPNPGPGGYGIVILRDGQRKELSGGFRKTTNNRMELFSVIHALRELGSPDGRVTIYSDSQYVVNMYSGGYARKWQRENWTRNNGKNAALNSDLWEDLLELGARCEARFVWVRGHADNRENARCDELAVAARQGENLPVDEEYENVAPRRQLRQLELFELA